MVEPSAQDTYKMMLKIDIVPVLRELGFKGSSGRYSLPSDTCWALLDFQKSYFSTARQIRFTINVWVIPRAVWDELRLARPDFPERPTTSYSSVAGNTGTRIGHLPGAAGFDKWWELHAGERTAPIAADVLHDIRSYAVPWMLEQIERHSA